MESHLKQASILVVEDEAIVARDIAEQLRELGYRVLGHAVNGAQAIDLAGQLRPDLILMDIALPGALDGIAAAEAIRAQWAIPVVFLSAFSDDSVLARATVAEPFGYLIKPFSERELRTVLEMALYKRDADARLRVSDCALKAVSQGVIITGADRIVISANDAFSAISGYRAHEIVGGDCRFLIGPATDPGTLAAIEQALRTATEFSGEILNYRKDGSTFWNEMTISPVRDAQRRLTHFIGVARDISKRKAGEQQARALKERLHEAVLHTQTILDNVADGVITIDTEGRIESFNQAACGVFGYAAQELIGHNVSRLMPQPHRSAHDGYLRHYRDSGEARIIGVPRELEGMRKDGSVFPMRLSVSRVERAGKTTFIGLVHDLSQRREDEASIRQLASFDSLTGLPNRHQLTDQLRQAMERSCASGEHGALMFLDLDHFKLLNDSHGHDHGDELLRQVARRINSVVGEGDLVARIGGDEFVVLLEALGALGPQAAARAESVADKILLSLRREYGLRAIRHAGTASIGIVLFRQQGDSIKELLKKADAAMYQAKAAGRDTARFFDPALERAAEARRALEQALRRGLEAHEFELHYQIQVDAGGAVQGVEALVRWNRGALGMAPPAQFIALAEETGLILPLGQWVLETACAQLAAWGGARATAGWSMAVNVSAAQFEQDDFVAHVLRALENSGADPALLKLELTESMLATNLDALIVKMNAIRKCGVRFSLDDFGTGYSSLSYLKRLPLDQLKIDQSFVREILTDPNDATIAHTIVALGHSLGLSVIAEGVETRAQRDFLAAAGCDAFQGYYFGRPVAAAQIAPPLARRYG
jgi:diguanylate cyclase (GGDEF)-like protein/PAS domain S-box-containing protein